MGLVARLLAPSIRLEPGIQLKYASRLEAVAYPSFERQSRLQDLSTTQAPENHEYSLKARSASRYIAEGILHFPPWRGLANHFVFEIKSPQNPVLPKWYLTLGRDETKIGGSPKVAAKIYLDRTEIVHPKDRDKVAGLIVEGIESHFWGDQPIAPEPPRNSQYYDGLINTIKVLAEDDYQRTLEIQLRSNPRGSVLPQRYQYDLSKGNIVLEPHHLQKIKL